ncbi:immunity 52 family protein [Candidatus Symbiopectobacterium sp. NZEC135]|uniref:immunity 52 family protein n=1 Tax=Candidatus Symbiopectobacterium sp. NZEC135 TaxID=2820471 RepID=UPI0022278F00|nr:immunity 52 family protein [Candidatus Symbiopectobacterium sp. NZEC135]MCW2478075.1 immunity 52 family protein [Candidatus Symbiopectobacterium sp. NZEC135]
MKKVIIKIICKEPDFKEIRDGIVRDTDIEMGANTILQRLLLLSSCYSEIRNNFDWYLTGTSQKDAMKKQVINGINSATDNASTLLFDSIKNDYPIIVKKIWNEFGDTILCSNFTRRNTCFFSYELICKINDEKCITNFTSKTVTKLIETIAPKIILVETNNYSRNEKNVFPDRFPVGWMFYTDRVFDRILPGLDSQMHDITKNDIKIGTLFISKKGFFDGNNENDIKQANDLEILLASHNILPTYKDIF